MGLKKEHLHVIVRPGTKLILTEMKKKADRTYIGTTHSIGGMIDLLAQQVKNPVERQRDKVKELASKLYMERKILEDMETVNDDNKVEQQSRKILEEEVTV